MNEAMLQFPGRLWRGVVDLVTPSLCLVCQGAVEDPASLCVDCWAKLKLIDEPVCDALGTPFAYDQGAGAFSPAALADPPVWDRARAAVLFSDDSARLVHALKYRDRPEAGLLMARLMAGAGRRLLAEADLLVPVPLHYFRLWQRRFNQSAFLATALAAAAGRPWRADLLRRRRLTRPQVGLDQAQRHRNVRGAFALRDDAAAVVAGRAVLIIDDVRTTGATAAACAEVLRQAGAARVDLLTFALVPPAGRSHI
jgi:ComF family protein